MKKQFLPFMQWVFLLLALQFFSLAVLGQSTDRVSTFTNKGSGPMYWSSVGYQYTPCNCWMDEGQWKLDIDWINTNFKSYGYDMVCDDGWGRSFLNVTPTGYRTRHDDSWTGSYKYWSDYLAARGMRLGIYSNPLWMTQAVMGDTNRNTYFVKGTTTPVIDLAYWDGTFNWVNPDHPAAEAFIKGYIQHFKDQGAKYLRMDFLENFENTFGIEKYERVMRWINEAAGNDLFLSYVLPKKSAHARVERKYADMMRVAFDNVGGWYALKTYSFAGFVTYADLNDKGNVINDGDFLKMTSFSNDEERKTAISLFAIAGSALGIIDQYSTIGTYGWVFQNNEILDLNKDGFAGKPFRFSDPNDVLSQYWKGQMSNGDWVVGLFNMDDAAATRSINFANDLNISGTATVRDMWAHSDLGSMTSYSATVPAHGCKMLRIKGTTVSASTKELEFGKMIGDASVYLDANASNKNGVGSLSLGSGVEMKNFSAGTSITLTYAVPYDAQISVYVNGVYAGKISLPSTGGWNSYRTATKAVSVPAGATIKFLVETGDAAANLDKLTVGSGGGSQLTGKVEAESATKFGGANVYSDPAASNGQGIGYISYSGDGIQFNNVAAQSSMTIHYAGQVNGQLSLFINGTFNQTITFPNTGAWTGIYADKSVTVSIPSGATVVIKNNGGSDVATNIDYVVFGGTSSGTTFEAEAGVPFNGAAVYNDPAASGTKGVGYISPTGGLYWTNVPASTSFKVHYAVNGPGLLGLYINNVFQQNVSFPSTGAWTGTYADVTVNKSIPANAMVTFRHDGGSDYAVNFDYITFSSSSARMAVTSTAGNSEVSKVPIIVYPNPVLNEFKIQLNGDYAHPRVIFYNSIGQAVIRKNLVKGENSISLKGQAQGSYFVQVIGNDKKIYSTTIVKQSSQ